MSQAHLMNFWKSKIMKRNIVVKEIDTEDLSKYFDTEKILTLLNEDERRNVVDMAIDSTVERLKVIFTFFE